MNITEESLKKLIAEVLSLYDIKEETIELKHRFIEDLGADLLDLEQILMDAEEEYSVIIPDNHACSLLTVGSLLWYIQLAERSGYSRAIAPLNFPSIVPDNLASLDDKAELEQQEQRQSSEDTIKRILKTEDRLNREEEARLKCETELKRQFFLFEKERQAAHSRQKELEDNTSALEAENQRLSQLLKASEKKLSERKINLRFAACIVFFALFAAVKLFEAAVM